MTRREAFVLTGLRLVGTPYLWDGKGFPAEPYRGFDCSGFVTYVLRQLGGPDLRATDNTAVMWAQYPHVDQAAVLPGDLALWARNDGTPHHVMVHLGIGEILFGSAGGDQSTTSLAANEAARATGRVMGVQLWQSPLAMSGFLGFVRTPWLDDGVLAG